MEACRLGAYRPAYRLSEARRHVRAELAVREALVRTRTRYIALAKALVRRDGLRVAGSESHLVAQRIAALELSATLAAELAPLFALLAPLNAQIAEADVRIAALTATDPAVALLTTAPSIGPITAAAIVATIDDVTRFRSAHQFEAYLGVVPSERSSGEQRRLGRITKAGNARARYLLVEAGWRLLRSRSAETAAVRAWALGIARAPREKDRGSRTRAPAGGHSVRDVAGPTAVRRGATSRAAGARGVASEHEGPRWDRLTDTGVASALQLMAAGESRELVGAVHSIAHPNAPRPMRLTTSANRRLSSSSRRSRTTEDGDTASALGT